MCRLVLPKGYFRCHWLNLTKFRSDNAKKSGKCQISGLFNLITRHILSFQFDLRVLVCIKRFIIGVYISAENPLIMEQKTQLRCL